MTSFKLVNVSSIFQNTSTKFARFSEWILLTYINNIFIFIDESLHQHCKHVQKILLQLRKAELQIDIDKCEFEVKSIKYLEFILKIEKDIWMNSQKIKNNNELKTSWSVKNIQSFIDFANFY
jgi:hypothetical protein